MSTKALTGLLERYQNALAASCKTIRDVAHWEQFIITCGYHFLELFRYLDYKTAHTWSIRAITVVVDGVFVSEVDNKHCA